MSTEIGFTLYASNIVDKPEPKEERANNPETWPFWHGDSWGGWSSTGTPVTRDTALQVPSVYSAVSMISADIAKLPLNLWKIEENRSREIYDRTGVQYMIHSEANTEQTARQFWRQILGDALIYNNGYAYIVRAGDGRPVELLPLLPDRTYPDRMPSTGQLIYRTSIDNYYEYIDPYDILHIRGMMLTNNRAREVNFLWYAQEAIGLALAAQDFESAFFRNGMRTTGVLEIPENMPKPSADNLANSFRQKYESRASWYKALILREGAKFSAIADQTMKDSATHELREDQVRDICRLYKLPPSRLALPDSVSYNSRAADNRQYYESALLPWMDMVVDECFKKLLLPGERRSLTYEFEYDTKSLLELDLTARYQAYAVGIQNKFLLPSEVRAKEGLPEIPGIDDAILNPQPSPFMQDQDDEEVMQDEDEDESEAERAKRYGANYERDTWLTEYKSKHTHDQLLTILPEKCAENQWTLLTTRDSVRVAIKRLREFNASNLPRK